VLLGDVALVQMSGLKDSGGDIVTAGTRSMTTGLVAVTVACCSSGFAGVYFEKVLKESEASLWVPNVELAVIGIVAGLAGVWYQLFCIVLAPLKFWLFWIVLAPLKFWEDVVCPSSRKHPRSRRTTRV